MRWFTPCRLFLSRTFIPLAALSASVLLPASAAAQLPVPYLENSFPLGAKAGTEVEVTLGGANLADLTAVLFDCSGVTATKIDTAKFRVSVAADCALGLHELRAVGRYGISTPRPFVVGSAPEILDPGNNHTRETAVPLTPPCVVQGQADSEQRDVYRFTATKGQVIELACVATALDSPMDPVITVTDATGTTLARGDDERDRDAQLTFMAPADGDYFLFVHDKQFAGSSAHLYRLTFSGETSPVPLLSPASAPDFNAVVAREIAEVEPNNSADTAQFVELPADVHGDFDNDWYSFKAEAGKALWLEVIADRSGYPCDPVLAVSKVTRDPQGKELGKQVLELDDQADLPAPPRWLLGSRDPAGSFVPDETATYRIRVADRFSRRGKYRLLIREVVPDFALVALADSPANEERKIFQWQPTIRRGGSAYFHVAVLRRGYDGEIRFRTDGLPPGVTASGYVPAGAKTGWLVLRAEADTKPWAGYVHVSGEGGGASREVRAMNYRWKVDNLDIQRLDARLCNLAVSVIDEPAPLTVIPAEEKVWETNVGSKLEIPLKLTRSGQPKGEWQLAAVGLPGAAKSDAVKIDGSATNDAKLGIAFENKDGNSFAPGTYTFFVRASGTVAYKADEKAPPKDFKHVEFSVPITVKLAPAPGTTAAK